MRGAPDAQHARVERDDGRNERLAVADDERVGYDRAGGDGVFGRFRSDVLAAGGDEEVLAPAGDVHEAIVVDARQIACFEPAVCGEGIAGGGGVVVVADEHARPVDLQLAVVGHAERDARTRFADAADAVGVLEVDAAGRGRFRQPIALDEGHAVQAVEEMGKVRVHGRAAAAEPLQGSARRRTHGRADGFLVEPVQHALGETVLAAGLLGFRPVGEVLSGAGEQAAAESGSGLLAGGVVDLLVNARDAEDIRRPERPEIGKQMLGGGHVGEGAARADGQVLRVAREAVGKRQEEQQAAGGGAHRGQDLPAGADHVDEVAVRQLRAFGRARRTGGEHDGGEVVGFHHSDAGVEFLVGNAPTVAGQRFQAIVQHVEDERRGRGFAFGGSGLELLAHAIDRLAPFGGVDERDGRFRQVRDAFDLRGRIRLVNGNGHRADRRAGEVEHAPLVPRRGPDQHGVSAVHAQRDQSFRRLPDGLEHLRGAHGRPFRRVVVRLVFHGHVVGEELRPLGEEPVESVVVAGQRIPQRRGAFAQHTLMLRPGNRCRPAAANKSYVIVTFGTVTMAEPAATRRRTQTALAPAAAFPHVPQRSAAAAVCDQASSVPPPGAASSVIPMCPSARGRAPCAGHV